MNLYNTLNLDKKPEINETLQIFKYNFNETDSLNKNIQYYPNEDIFIELHLKPFTKFKYDATFTDSTNLISSWLDSTHFFPILSFDSTYSIDSTTKQFIDNGNLLVLYIHNNKLVLEGKNNNKLSINLDEASNGFDILNEKYISNLYRIIIGKHGKTTYMSLFLISDEKVLFYTDTTNDIFPTTQQNINVTLGKLTRSINNTPKYIDYLGGYIYYVIVDNKATSYPFIQHYDYKHNKLSKALKINNYQLQKFNIINSKFYNLDIFPLYLTSSMHIEENNILNINPKDNYIYKIDEQPPTFQDSTEEVYQNFDIIPSLNYISAIKYNLHDIQNGYSMLSFDYKNIFATNSTEMPFNINFISNKSINGQKDEAICIYELNVLFKDNTTQLQHDTLYFIPIQERGQYYIDNINDGTCILIDTTYTCKDTTGTFTQYEIPMTASDIDIDSTYYENDETTIVQFNYSNIIDENLLHHEMIQKTAFRLKHFILIENNKLTKYSISNASSYALDPFDSNITIGDSTNLDSTIIYDSRLLYNTIKNAILELEPNFYLNCKFVNGITENAHIVNIPHKLPYQLTKASNDGCLYNYQLLNQNYKILLNPDSTVKLPPIDFVITKRIQNTKLDYSKSPYIVSTNNIDKILKIDVDKKQKANISNLVGFEYKHNMTSDYYYYEIIYNQFINYIPKLFNDNTSYLIKPYYSLSSGHEKINASPESNLLPIENIIYYRYTDKLHKVLDIYYLTFSDEDKFISFDVPYTFFNKYYKLNTNINNTIMLTINEPNGLYNQLSPYDIFYSTKTTYEEMFKLTPHYVTINSLIGYQPFDSNYNEIDNSYTSSGNGNSISLTQGINTTSNAVDFGNNNSEQNYIKIDNIPLNTKMSFSMYIFKHSNNTSFNTILCIADSGNPNRITLREDVVNTKIQIIINGSIYNITNYILSTNKQHHISLTLNETNVQFQLNKTLIANIYTTSSLDTSHSNNTLILGQGQSSQNNIAPVNYNLLGKIDQFKIFYTKTLTENEVYQLYDEKNTDFNILNETNKPYTFLHKLKFINANYEDDSDEYSNIFYYPTWPKMNNDSNDKIVYLNYPIELISYYEYIINFYIKYKIKRIANSNRFTNKV